MTDMELEKWMQSVDDRLRGLEWTVDVLVMTIIVLVAYSLGPFLHAFVDWVLGR